MYDNALFCTQGNLMKDPSVFDKNFVVAEFTRISSKVDLDNFDLVCKLDYFYFLFLCAIPNSVFIAFCFQ